MSDITTLEQDIAELRAALDAMARKLDTVLVQAGKVGINMPDITDANGATVKKAPEAALDVTGPVVLRSRDLKFGDQRTDGPGQALFDNKGALIINNSKAWPAVDIGSSTVIHGDLTAGNASVTGEITEGGKKLKEKYQPAGKYQPEGKYQKEGNYLASGKDAQVKNLTVTGKLIIGAATISVVRCKYFRNEHNGFQGYFPAHPGAGWHEHLNWESDCIMVKTNNGVVYLGPFG